ncbi:hypothetical protein BDV96DRAFT_494291 [Lophiotrema nucula]|uniref:Rhodopsin domain-containing protein n=1 Tax=Lophiotrema nucula TaxID=690887 RepID=A0A6A5Z6P2_9PLEO|nr:hypothetical protein BDV96DRAFT_494291 [Lophiotrema nucula]
MRSDDLDKQKWQAIPATMNRRRLEGVNTAMLVVTAVFFAARVVVRLVKRKPFELHDVFCYSSFLCYVGMCVMYYKENDPLYRVEGVQRGEIPPYSDILHDAGMIYRWLTASQLLFYSSLTSVKLSLLTLYRRLLDRTPAKFTYMWWGILAFCILSYIGSTITTLTVCDNQGAKYNRGECAKANEQKRAQISLWFAYGVDVATDLAVMFLPFRMTWNLQMPRTEKLGVFVLFGTGWVCILFATLRVVQVGVKDGVPKTPDPKWLQMWTVIETSMAVIIGCLPAFAVVIRNRFGTKKGSYDSRGYVKRSTDVIKMKSVGSGSSGLRTKDDELWPEAHGSQEALAHDAGHITVTTTIHQNDIYAARPSIKSSREVKPL